MDPMVSLARSLLSIEFASLSKQCELTLKGIISETSQLITIIVIVQRKQTRGFTMCLQHLGGRMQTRNWYSNLQTERHNVRNFCNLSFRFVQTQHAENMIGFWANNLLENITEACPSLRLRVPTRPNPIESEINLKRAFKRAFSPASATNHLAKKISKPQINTQANSMVPMHCD